MKSVAEIKNKKQPLALAFLPQKSSGFTLIELLVVIAIIALLASVVFVSLSATRQKARDAKRVADLNQLGKAFELYFNQNFSYPTLAVSGSLNNLTYLTPTYLTKLPTTVTPADGTCGAGPGNGTNDYYFYANNANNVAASYTLTFCLGVGSGVLGPGPHTLTQAGFQ